MGPHERNRSPNTEMSPFWYAAPYLYVQLFFFNRQHGLEKERKKFYSMLPHDAFRDSACKVASNPMGDKNRNKSFGGCYMHAPAHADFLTTGQHSARFLAFFPLDWIKFSQFEKKNKSRSVGKGLCFLCAQWQSSVSALWCSAVQWGVCLKSLGHDGLLRRFGVYGAKFRIGNVW